MHGTNFHLKNTNRKSQIFITFDFSFSDSSFKPLALVDVIRNCRS